MPIRLTLTSFSCAVLLAVAIPSPCASGQSFFMTPISNAPFSVVINIERTVVHKDGSVKQFKATREGARDTRGRIHNELRALIPVSSNHTPELLFIHLYDPQSRISTEIDVRKRTFSTRTMNHPPSTEPPTIRFAAPDGNARPNEFHKTRGLWNSRDRGRTYARDSRDSNRHGRERWQGGRYYRRVMVLAGPSHQLDDQT